MKLVIAEKPVLARDIARAICGSKNTRLPIVGNGYTVTACAGHLLELVEPDELSPKWGKPWKEESLPICIHDWPKKPAKGKEKLVSEIGELLKKADMVIHAGDPDEEGQLIVDELLDYYGYHGPVRRVYVNDSIEKNIVKAFNELVDNKQCRAAGEAARARQMADKAFGYSETRLATIRLHSMFSVGRVQTPTLGLVVARDESIEKHEVRKFFELMLDVLVDDRHKACFRFKPGEELLEGEKHLFDKRVLEDIACSLGKGMVAIETKVGQKTTNPPLPFNLTVLISEMSAKFGYSAEKTQSITQKLRDEYRAITYNRTDSQYLKEEHYQEAPAVLGRAMKNIGLELPVDYSLKSKAFNDANVTAHHGIIPQEISLDISKMSTEELNVYQAIVERYAMQFLPPFVEEISSSVFAVDGGVFEAKSKRVLNKGFKEFFAGDVEPKSENPWIEEGRHSGKILNSLIEERSTTPPKPYTEGTLIADMASIAKYVMDPEIKKIMQLKDQDKKGENGSIGTTATRASIIEKLKQRGFVEVVKGKIVSTSKGRAFYHAVPKEIAGVDTTARWWLVQQEVAAGKKNANALQDSVVEVFNNHRNTAYSGVEIAKHEVKTIGVCPRCGQPIVLKGKVYDCSSNKAKKVDGKWVQTAGCGFKVFPWCGKMFTERQMGNLLAGKTISVRGAVSKAGKKFDCKMQLNGDGLQPIFE